MRTIGYTMLTVGFLAGALAAVIDKADVNWFFFLPSVSAGLAGVALLRLAHKRTHHHQDRITANIRLANQTLSRITENISRLNSEKASYNPYDVRHRLDELFAADLAAFVDARRSIAVLYGLQAYADVMSCFAAGERYINRVWSASADGYIDEVNEYIEKAKNQFAEALEKLSSLSAGRQQ